MGKFVIGKTKNGQYSNYEENETLNGHVGKRQPIYTEGEGQIN